MPTTAQLGVCVCLIGSEAFGGKENSEDDRTGRHVARDEKSCVWTWICVRGSVGKASGVASHPEYCSRYLSPPLVAVHVSGLRDRSITRTGCARFCVAADGFAEAARWVPLHCTIAAEQFAKPPDRFRCLHAMLDLMCLTRTQSPRASSRSFFIRTSNSMFALSVNPSANGRADRAHYPRTYLDGPRVRAYDRTGWAYICQDWGLRRSAPCASPYRLAVSIGVPGAPG